jgi:hypothetical protein
MEFGDFAKNVFAIEKKISTAKLLMNENNLEESYLCY